MAQIASTGNDTRGWIMCVASAIACVFGASFICLDILVRCIPGKRDFDIQKSTAFQAASYSLSFGVMIYSSLYKMLPSSKTYLVRAGFSDQNAAWILLGSFSGGFIGIQVLLRLVHPYMPSHVETCDHQHEEFQDEPSEPQKHDHHAHVRSTGNRNASESTPLLSSKPLRGILKPTRPLLMGLDGSGSAPARRTSIIEVPQRVMSFVMDRKNQCDKGGPCFGYTDPCGQECHKTSRRASMRTKSPTKQTPRRPISLSISRKQPTIQENNDASESSMTVNPSTSCDTGNDHDHGDHPPRSAVFDLESQHHHHVPENAYMSTGLQTSIAIALHKLPEGFIMYATNHASVSLGVSVFFALFIHNLTEGFVLALPIYLAIGSRIKAMIWAAGLGGLSQPLGAGIAALWFHIAGRDGSQPGPTGYGCLFAATSGIMTSVALHLFAEGLSLNHSKNMCIFFGFVGIAILGAGNALTN